MVCVNLNGCSGCMVLIASIHTDQVGEICKIFAVYGSTEAIFCEIVWIRGSYLLQLKKILGSKRFEKDCFCAIHGKKFCGFILLSLGVAMVATTSYPH